MDDKLAQQIVDAVNQPDTTDVTDASEQAQIETEISKIKVGEEEYTQEELSQLVGLGKIGRDLESKWNTKIDKVYPEYTKAQNRIKELEESAAQPAAATPPSDLTDAQKTEARKILKEQFGVVFQDELDKHIETTYTNRREAEKLLEQSQKLEGEINGTDGRPAFKLQEILEYMKEQGIRSPDKAYKLKYESELDAWKEAQLGKAKRPGMATHSVSQAGAKQPAEVKPTRDNLTEIIGEVLRNG